MAKIDRRRTYYMVVDTETCNTFKTDNYLDTKSALVYDIGFVITDKHGNIYHSASYLIKEILVDMPECMQTAYYINKLPEYRKGYKQGEHELKSFFQVWGIMLDLMKEYNIKAFCAYNARFDVEVLNATLRYLSKSKYRYFIPNSVEKYDILKMACDVISKKPTYKTFAFNNGLTTHNNTRVSVSAENVYRYLLQDENYIEKHTGLQDVYIETAIMAHCFRQHKSMRKLLWE